jgi:hypothetical protein
MYGAESGQDLSESEHGHQLSGRHFAGAWRGVLEGGVVLPRCSLEMMLFTESLSDRSKQIYEYVEYYWIGILRSVQLNRQIISLRGYGDT